MRTIWKGMLELGEVAIPVGLVSAVRELEEPTRRLHASCQSPVSVRPYCPVDAELLEWDPDTVRAYEVAPGQYLVPTQEQAKQLEPPETRSIPIGCFVDADTIAPALVQKRYHLTSTSPLGARAYTLLAGAMNDLDVVALVRFVAWKTEWIAAIASDGAALELARLHFQEDLVALDHQDEPPAIDTELAALARQLVERHTRQIRPDDLASTERPIVRQLLEQLLAGHELVRPEPPTQHKPQLAGPDLETALRRSLTNAPKKRRARATAAV